LIPILCAPQQQICGTHFVLSYKNGLAFARSSVDKLSRSEKLAADVD
jgi:hypothetical protein